jgi:hypothetical protein
MVQKNHEQLLVPFVTRRWDQDDVVFRNWGYEEDPPMGLPLAPSDEPNRSCIQHSAASS